MNQIEYAQNEYFPHKNEYIGTSLTRISNGQYVHFVLGIIRITENVLLGKLVSSALKLTCSWNFLIKSSKTLFFQPPIDCECAEALSPQTDILSHIMTYIYISSDPILDE